MGAALTEVNVAEDVAVATEATLVSSEDEVLTGAAIAFEETLLARSWFATRNTRKRTSANSEGSKNEFEEVLHLVESKTK